MKGNITLEGGQVTSTSDTNGFYFTGSNHKTLTVSIALSADVAQRFFVNSNVISFDEIYNGTMAQVTVGGAIPTRFGYSIWPATGNVIKDVTIDNSAGVSLNYGKSINSNLYLTNGVLNNSTKILAFNTGSTIHRTGGSISNTPTFNGLMHVNYPSYSVGLTTGNEIPTATDKLNNLTISNEYGIKADRDFTVNGILALNANNPDETSGLLDMVISYGDYATRVSPFPAYDEEDPPNPTDPISNNSTNQYNNLNSYVLGMGSLATITGSADVTGKIKRNHTFISGTPYSFGNTNTQLTFTSIAGSTLPSSIVVVATKGNKGLHADKDGNDSYRGDGTQPNTKAAVKRLYQVLRTGGTTATRMTIRLAYDTNALNGNNADNLVLWDHHLPYGGISPHEHGQTNRTSNYVELTGHGLFYLAQENDTAFTKYWMIAEKETSDIIWIGAVPGGSWDVLSNWSDGLARTGTDKIVIPSDASYQYELILSDNESVGTIEVKPGGKFTLKEGKTLTINGGPAVNGGAGSWNNQGIFVSEDNSTVLFNYANATISGSGDFYNLQVASEADLRVSGETNIKIKNNLNILGKMDAVTEHNTISFIGANQSIPVPISGIKTGYHNLIVSQSSGEATLLGNTRIGGMLTLTNGNLNVGNNTLSLEGEYLGGNVNFLKTIQGSPLEIKNMGGGTFNLPDFTEINNLSFNAPFSSFNVTQNATLYGNLTIENSMLNLNDKSLNRNVLGGTLTLGESSYLKIGGSNGLPQNFTTHSIQSSSTVEYAGGDQEITEPTTGQKYGNLILSETGTKKLPETVNKIEISENLTLQNNAALLLDTTKTLVISKRLINLSGSALFKDRSSLVQIDNLTNEGIVTYQRNTRELKHLDFVYWGAMVNNRMIKDIWMTNASESFYQFNAASNSWTLLSGNTLMTPGRGYIARARYISGGWPINNVFPLPPGVPIYQANFTNTPNNGNIIVDISADKHNLLGNPYPSAIDMEEFMKQGEESVEDGPFLPTYYIWTQTTPITNNSYTGNDYAYYNAATSTATSVADFTPNKYLNAGQAFFIKTKATAPAQVLFNNEQRVINQNDNFTKPGNSKSEKNIVSSVMDRYWLNLKNSIQDYKQIAIVHLSKATNEYDQLLESPAFNGNANMNFFSLVGTSRIGIQARASMITQDEFLLGFQASIAGTYQIELAKKEGIFDTHPIYLEDMLTNQVHNLQSGVYSFSTSAGLFLSRFKIKYEDVNLGTNPMELQNLVAYFNNQTLFVKTSGEILEKVEIYDIQGRLLQSLDKIQSIYLEKNLLLANQVVIIKIKTTDGKTGTKKLIY